MQDENTTVSPTDTLNPGHPGQLQQPATNPTIPNQNPVQPPPATPVASVPLTVSPGTVPPEPQSVYPTISNNSPVSQVIAPQEQIVSELHSSPSPVVIHGYNDTTYRKGSGGARWGLITGGISALVVVVGAVMYLWLLPLLWSNAYAKNVKPLYQQQASQIATVYQSIDRPLFTSDDASAASDAQDFQYISGVTATAIDNTNALKAKNHLTVLPGTTWQHSVSKANSEYQAMQQYVSDSQTFLQDYTALVTYLQQLGRVANAKLPALINDTDVINKGTSSVPTFITDLQTATTDLQSFSSQLKDLDPPADLQVFNQNLLNASDDMEKALSAQQTDLQSNNESDFRQQLAVYVSAYNNFVNLLSSNPTANIATNSKISTEISTLQAEHPL